MDYKDLSQEELIRELKRRDDKRVALEQMYKSLDVLEMIHMAQTDFISVNSESNIFHQMLEHFLSITGSEYGFIDEMFYRDDGTMYLEARSITNIAWDDDSHSLYEKLVSGEIVFENLKSLYGEVMKTGAPIIANDAPRDPRRCGIPEGHPDLNAFLGLPLHAGGEFVGMLGLANAPGGFSEEMVKHLEPLVKVCSIIMYSFKIDQRRQESLHEIEEQNQQLESFNKMAVGRELRMIELKEEINAMAKELGRPEPYDISFADK
ncbi:MAG: GAF domain-containing protein [Planctomycetota bacterium]|nr:GAF domain-containing protein [Planctomycetota bacterium]MDA1140506.1 GAF domain-containing protein [Planctomycetota bacterium]